MLNGVVCDCDPEVIGLWDMRVGIAPMNLGGIFW